ncbi:HK97 family phage prohead protease [Oceaniradius stylonematis]|uniref:HK97 family phage prohead protease n=1 Tax=Oceaniradius stylonematis TaxID=2184161 RepID=UPI00273DE64E|nr:HK97 family phage prohead protease [Oceaniradius stylonematis]
MPKSLTVDLDEVIEKRAPVAKDGKIFRAASMPASWNDENRSARFVMSTEEPDSYRDIVVQEGISLERFANNPIALFGHMSWQPPIGSWSDIKFVRGKPKRTEGTLTFTKEGVDDTADRVARHVEAGTLRAVSIGFMPTKIERITDDEDRWTGGYRFHECELFECSVVTVPAVANALVKGHEGEQIVTPEIIDEFLETIKNAPGVAQMVDKDHFEAVYRELTGNKTSLLVEAPSIEIKGLEQLEALTERMERAAGIEPEDAPDPDEQREAAAFEALEREIEKAVTEIEPEAEELSETGKQGLSLIIDKIKSVFLPPEQDTISEAEQVARQRKAEERYERLGEILKANA